MRLLPHLFDHFNCDRAKLEKALQTCGSNDYYVVDEAAEAALRDAAAKYKSDFATLVFEYNHSDPGVEFQLSHGVGLIRPWCPPGLARAGGWIASLARPHKPPLTLAKNADGMYGRTAVFTTAELATWATALHAADRARQPLNINDGLHWSAVGPIPGATL
jgi:hypothetical protein